MIRAPIERRAWDTDGAVQRFKNGDLSWSTTRQDGRYSIYTVSAIGWNDSHFIRKNGAVSMYPKNWFLV